MSCRSKRTYLSICSSFMFHDCHHDTMWFLDMMLPIQLTSRVRYRSKADSIMKHIKRHTTSGGHFLYLNKSISPSNCRLVQKSHPLPSHKEWKIRRSHSWEFGRKWEALNNFQIFWYDRLAWIQKRVWSFWLRKSWQHRWGKFLFQNFTTRWQ